MKTMKVAALCLLALALSACNPTFDRPPLLHGSAAVGVAATAPSPAS